MAAREDALKVAEEEKEGMETEIALLKKVALGLGVWGRGLRA